MDYDYENLALEHTLDGRQSDARNIIREHLTDPELEHLSDALDALAALVDEEQIRRIETRR